MKEKTLVIGIGNVLMKDDGIGIYVVEELKKDRFADIRFVIGETDIDYIIDEIHGSKADNIVIIDASLPEGSPGKITTFRMDQQVSHMNHRFSMHEAHLFDCLAPRECCRCLIVCIEAYNIGFGYGLSHKLLQELPSIGEAVGKILEEADI